MWWQWGPGGDCPQHKDDYSESHPLLLVCSPVIRSEERKLILLCLNGQFYPSSTNALRCNTSLTWYWTVSCMAPRWTGMWGALDTRPPSGPNTAQEKSRRSLMLVEMEVLWSTLPICSVEHERQNTLRQINMRLMMNVSFCFSPHFHPLFSKVVPAMLMKRWEKMESCTALSSVPRTQWGSEPTVMQISPPSVRWASQHGSTRTVLIQDRAAKC